MDTLKLTILALVLFIISGFIGAAKSEAWARHRHIHKIYGRTYVTPRSVVVWVPGHWAYNKFGISVWRIGHWKRVYRY